MLRVGIKQPLILLSVLFLTAPSLGWSKTGNFVETPLAKCVVDRFREYENSKPVLRDAPVVELPAEIRPISLDRASCEKDFNLAVGVFRFYWNDAVVARIREIALKGANGDVSEAERSDLNGQLKEARAALKNLRFIYEALDRDHDVPKELDELTTAIGKLRDVIQGKRGDPKDLMKFSNRVLMALDPELLKNLDREVADFKPDNRSGFNDWMKKKFRKTKEILSRRARSADDFHQVRKNLQSVLAVYRAELDYQPEKKIEWTPIIQFLTQVTEQVGQQHEKWERSNVAGDIDYDEDKVKLPKKVVRRLLDFISQMGY